MKILYVVVLLVVYIAYGIDYHQLHSYIDVVHVYFFGIEHMEKRKYELYKLRRNSNGTLSNAHTYECLFSHYLNQYFFSWN